MSLQEKMSKLDEMIEWFEGENFELEKAVEKYKQAERMAEEIAEDLKTLKNEVSVVSKNFSINEAA